MKTRKSNTMDLSFKMTLIMFAACLSLYQIHASKGEHGMGWFILALIIIC